MALAVKSEPASQPVMPPRQGAQVAAALDRRKTIEEHRVTGDVAQSRRESAGRSEATAGCRPLVCQHGLSPARQQLLLRIEPGRLVHALKQPANHGEVAVSGRGL